MILRPYQVAAADKLEAILRERRIAYLRGEVRVGKTAVALSLQQRFKAGGHILVLTAKKAIPSIVKDAKDLLGDGAQFVTVTNYESVHKLERRSWMLIICDEAHRLGTYPKPSKRLKDVRTLNAALWLLMSGTPSPESLSQMYHQFSVGMGPWLTHKNFYSWARDYVIIGKQYVGTGQTVNTYNNAIESKVLADIEPYTVTVTQQDAGFETRIEERIHHVRMKERTYRMAQRIIKDGIIGGMHNRCVLADSGAKVMSKCQQVYNGHVITERHGAIIFDRSKVEYIQRTFTGKLAILYRYKAEGAMLMEAFGDRAVDTPEAFNSDPRSVFIGQVQSSREGVNLSSAEDLVFMGVDYSALSYIQGKDRASYLGRTKANRVHFIFAEGGIEDKVYAMVSNKLDYTLTHFKRDARIQVPSEGHQAVAI